MKTLSLAIAITVAVIVLTGSATVAGSQTSIDEARGVFERVGCTSCHTAGGVAPPFDEVVSMIAGWRGKYASIDEAVRAEVEYFGGQKFNTYNELMKVMAANVGKTPQDPEIQQLTQFFQDIYNGKTQTTQTTATETEAGEGGGGAPGSGLFYGAVITGTIFAVVLFAAFSRLR